MTGDKNHIFKRVLLGIVMALLLLPLLQDNLSLFHVKKLSGAFKSATRVTFTTDYWLDGYFQKPTEDYLDQNFGFRNTLVRLNNQLRFDLFKKSTSGETVIGKEQEMFAKDYIRAYCGQYYIGCDSLLKKSRLVKEIQMALKQKGIVFLPILAPNKARALSQLLPDTCRKGYSNYDAFKTLFNSMGIRYMDFNSYFAEQVSKSPYPLFSKFGLHWSSYGHFLAADSIARYLSSSYGFVTPQMIWKDSIEMSDSLRDLDYDVGEGLNLLADQLPTRRLAYPKPRFGNLDREKPSILVVGDSYNFGLEMTGIYEQVFSDYKFFYYFRELRPYNGDPTAFYAIDLKREIEKHKVILLIATEHNMVNYGFGFLEYMNAMLKGQETSTVYEYDKRVNYFEKAIRSDQNWFGKIEKESVINGWNLDSLVTENARYMVNQERTKKP